MKLTDAKFVRELKEIARQDRWSAQRLKSMLGILQSLPDDEKVALLRTVKERRPKR